MRNILIDNYEKEELNKIVNQSFSYSEVIRKLGYKTSCGRNSDTLKDRIEKYGISTEHFKIVPRKTHSLSTVFVKDSTVSQHTLRNWYAKGKYTPYICSICNQEPIWNGNNLTLILDHIDGDNRNNVLDNLRWVCPNCDRQLDTSKKT